MPELLYQCPGEAHPIAASVHFARLRAGFARCQDCPSQKASGNLEFISLPAGFLEKSNERTSKDVAPKFSEHPTFRADQPEFIDQALHFLAHWFWNQQGYVPINQDIFARTIITRPQIPTLIVGYDGDFTTSARLKAIIERLNFYGIKIVDAGLLPVASLEFLRIQLETDGYLHLAQIKGPQFSYRLEAQGHANQNPLTAMGSVTSKSTTNDSVNSTLQREVRSSGGWRTYSGLQEYESTLIRRLHGLRPIKICLGVSNTYHQNLVQHISEEWPCKIIEFKHDHPLEELNTKLSPPVLLTRKMSQLIRQHRGDLGCVILPDGLNCIIWDDQGTPLTSIKLVELLATFLLQEYPDEEICIPPDQLQLQQNLNIYQHRVILSGQLEHQKITNRFRLLYDEQFNIWHKDPELRRDGWLTLIYLLKKLSQQDSPLSQLCQLKTL